MSSPAHPERLDRGGQIAVFNGPQDVPAAGHRQLAMDGSMNERSRSQVFGIIVLTALILIYALIRYYLVRG